MRLNDFYLSAFLILLDCQNITSNPVTPGVLDTGEMLRNYFLNESKSKTRFKGIYNKTEIQQLLILIDTCPTFDGNLTNNYHL